jgi:hypothetical protein
LWNNLLPAAYAADGPGATSVLSSVFTTVGWVIVFLIGIPVFAIVWFVGHALSVVFGWVPFLGWAPRTIRGTTLLGMGVASWLNPWLCVLYCLILIVVAYFLFGWSVRWVRLGMVYSTDLLFFRSAHIGLSDTTVRAFSGAAVAHLPKRCYGTVSRKPDGAFEYIYRNLPFFPRKTLAIPAGEFQYEIGRGLLNPCIIRSAGGDQKKMFLLTPRYRGCETEIGRVLGIASIRDAGWRGAWHWLREQFGSGNQARAQA